jgi:hypothetical protein
VADGDEAGGLDHTDGKTNHLPEQNPGAGACTQGETHLWTTPEMCQSRTTGTTSNIRRHTIATIAQNKNIVVVGETTLATCDEIGKTDVHNLIAILDLHARQGLAVFDSNDLFKSSLTKRTCVCDLRRCVKTNTNPIATPIPYIFPLDNTSKAKHVRTTGEATPHRRVLQTDATSGFALRHIGLIDQHIGSNRTVSARGTDRSQSECSKTLEFEVLDIERASNSTCKLKSRLALGNFEQKGFGDP